MNKIRVLVVEDSITTRKYLVEVLESQDYVEVVGEAGDGQTAIDMCMALRPDVVTMDIVLPVKSGMAATEYIMSHCPTPILIVSSSLNRAEVYQTYDALAAGAVDVLPKPGADADAAWARQFCSALRVVSRVSVVTRRPRVAAPALRTVAVDQPASGRREIVVLGASTGGPGALLEILRGLPSDFALPILLVLHISDPFGAAMASWLTDQTPFRVVFAEDGQRLASISPGEVLMAWPDRHLELVGNRLRLTDAPPRYSCRPSVDVLFSSVASAMGSVAIGCLLTGMGRDGAAGLLELRNAGACTIAQDEASSVVFGMPGEAVRLGAARHVLPLSEIAEFISRAAREGREP